MESRLERNARFQRQWRAKQSADSRRRIYLRDAYKISPKEFEKQLERQNGHCALCPETLDLQVDHDHECCNGRPPHCGKCNRVILCPSCNMRLGLLEALLSTTDWLSASLDYIDRAQFGVDKSDRP